MRDKGFRVLAFLVLLWLVAPAASATHFVLEKDYKVKGTEYLEDIDNDGHAELLVLNLSINCTGSGEYAVTGALYTEDDQMIDTTSTQARLAYGIDHVLLKFSTRKMAERQTKEKYVLKYVKIVNETGIEEDYRYQAYTTREYDYRQLFPLPDVAARITGPSWAPIGRVTVSGIVENKGNTLVDTRACFYSVFSSGDLLARECKDIKGLEPGESVEIGCNVTIYSPGEHEFLLSVPLGNDIAPGDNNGTGRVLVMEKKNLTLEIENPWGEENPGISLLVPGTDLSYGLEPGKTLEVMDPTSAGVPATILIEENREDSTISIAYNLTTLPEALRAGAGWSTSKDLGSLMVYEGMAVFLGDNTTISSCGLEASFPVPENTRNTSELGLYVCETIPSQDMECSTGWKRVADLQCSSTGCTCSIAFRHPVWGVALAEPEYCGNGYCAPGESKESCPEDCGITSTIRVNETLGTIEISGLQPGISITRNTTAIPFLYRISVSTSKNAGKNETLVVRLLDDYQEYEPYQAGSQEFYPLVLLKVEALNSTRPVAGISFMVPESVTLGIGVLPDELGVYAYDGSWSSISSSREVLGGATLLEASVVPGYVYALGAEGFHEEKKSILERIVEWFSFLWENEKETGTPSREEKEAGDSTKKKENVTTWAEFFENQSNTYNWSRYEPPVRAEPRVWSPEGGASMFILQVLLGVLGLLILAMLYMRYGGAIKDKVLGIDKALQDARKEQKKKKTTTYKRIVQFRKDLENLRDVVAQYSSSIDFDAMDWDEKLEDISGLLEEAEDFLDLGNEEKAQLKVRQAEEKLLVLKHEIYASLT